MSEPSEIDIDVPFEPPKGAMLAIFLIVLSDLMGFGSDHPAPAVLCAAIRGYGFPGGAAVCRLFGLPARRHAAARPGQRSLRTPAGAAALAGRQRDRISAAGFATKHNWTHVQMGLMMVYICRAIDGLSGGNISTAQAYISDVTTAKNRAKGMGMLGAAFGIGFTIGPWIGGMLGAQARPRMAARAGRGNVLRYRGASDVSRLPESRATRHSEAEVWLHPSRFLPIIRNSRCMQTAADLVLQHDGVCHDGIDLRDLPERHLPQGQRPAVRREGGRLLLRLRGDHHHHRARRLGRTAHQGARRMDADDHRPADGERSR